MLGAVVLTGSQALSVTCSSKLRATVHRVGKQRPSCQTFQFCWNNCEVQASQHMGYNLLNGLLHTVHLLIHQLKTTEIYSPTVLEVGSSKTGVIRSVLLSKAPEENSSSFWQLQGFTEVAPLQSLTSSSHGLLLCVCLLLFCLSVCVSVSLLIFI